MFIVRRDCLCLCLIRCLLVSGVSARRRGRRLFVRSALLAAVSLTLHPPRRVRFVLCCVCSPAPSLPSPSSACSSVRICARRTERRGDAGNSGQPRRTHPPPAHTQRTTHRGHTEQTTTTTRNATQARTHTRAQPPTRNRQRDQRAGQRQGGAEGRAPPFVSPSVCSLSPAVSDVVCLVCVCVRQRSFRRPFESNLPLPPHPQSLPPSFPSPSLLVLVHVWRAFSPSPGRGASGGFDAAACAISHRRGCGGRRRGHLRAHAGPRGTQTPRNTQRDAGSRGHRSCAR